MLSGIVNTVYSYELCTASSLSQQNWSSDLGQRAELIVQSDTFDRKAGRWLARDKALRIRYQ